MDDVTADKPGKLGGSVTSEMWFPYASSGSPPPLDAPVLEDCTELLSRERITLHEITAPLGYYLVLQELNVKTVTQLISWKDNLPSALQVDVDAPTKPYLPHVLLLHMQYHQSMIHAHRPWMSKTLTQPQPKKGPGYVHARETCIRSAISIGKLLCIYESQYSLSRMNIHGVGITCTAASILIFACVSLLPNLSSQDVLFYLGACFRALDCFSPSWEVARKTRDFLVLFQRKWQSFSRSTNASRKRSWPEHA
ncbi:hypothetical protein SLS62_010422 [Diatrype stigma]|uniref:Uncharacterized protein n=1 Tax=Diatrype stigma TaxID=117547 RepID=A0AAN9YIT8_9PEZI